MTDFSAALSTSLLPTPTAGRLEFLRTGSYYTLYVTGGNGIRYAPAVLAHSHDIATAATNGFMSSAMFTKLNNLPIADRIVFGDNERATLGGVDIDTASKTGIHYASVGTRPQGTNAWVFNMAHNLSGNSTFSQFALPNSMTRKPAWRIRSSEGLQAWDYFVTENTFNSVANAAGYITSSALSSYATQSWVEGKNYLTQGTADGRYGRLEANNAWLGQQFISRGNSTGTGQATFLDMRGTDHTTGSTQRLFIQKLSNATDYNIGMTNDAPTGGWIGSKLNVSVDNFTYRDAKIATENWVTSQGYITSVSGYVPTSRTITVGMGMTGGGNLGGNISIGLSFGTNSDNVAAGNHTHSQYALTSHTHEVSQINNLTNLLNGKVGTGTTITINGVTQDLSQNRSWTVSGGGGGNVTGSGAGSNNPVALWTSASNISYSTLYYYTAGSPSRKILGIGGAMTGAIGDMALYVEGGANIYGYVATGNSSGSIGSDYLEFEARTSTSNPKGSMPFPLMSGANFETAKSRYSGLNGMFGFDTTNNVITWVQGDTIVKLGITEWGVMTKHGTSPWRYVEA